MQNPARTPSIATLRHAIARLEGAAPRLASSGLVSLGHQEADARLDGGLRSAALHEVYARSDPDGAAAIGFALALAARAAAPVSWKRAPLVWIRHDLATLEWGEVYAPGLVEWGLDPERFVIVSVPQAADSLKAAHDALQCGAIGALLIESAGDASVWDLTASRRLALAAGHSGVTAIALRLGAKPKPSAADTRWLIAGVPSRDVVAGHLGFPAFDAALIRSRKGRVGRWIMEWDSDAYLFRAAGLTTNDAREDVVRPAHPGAPAAASVHRSHQVPARGRLRHTG